MSSRYQNIAITTTPEIPARRYVTLKYPEIQPDVSDTYVYTSKGDRFDTLAISYYNDSSLWWVISLANPTLPQNSITPPSGIQIRIPSRSRISSILAEYDNLNKL